MRRLVSGLGSVRQLDVLLLMRAEGQTRTWTTSELNRVLRSSETALEQDLAGLLDAGLVQTTHGPPTEWSYAAGQRAHVVDELASCYRTHRTAIIALIARQQPRATLDAFADAFRIRKADGPDG